MLDFPAASKISAAQTMTGQASRRGGSAICSSNIWACRLHLVHTAIETAISFLDFPMVSHGMWTFKDVMDWLCQNSS